MFARFLLTLAKIAVGSLVVGTILSHFGITIEVVLREAGLTPERLNELVRQAVAWALPNMALGAIIILPVWLVILLLRPPIQRRD